MSKENISLLKQELEQAKSIAEQNAAAATYFSQRLNLIDAKINLSSFKGKFVKKLFWVISNWKELISILEFVYETLEQTKKDLQAAKEKAEADLKAIQ